MRIAAAVLSAISLATSSTPSEAFVSPASSSRLQVQAPRPTLLRDVVAEENAEAVESESQPEEVAAAVAGSNNGASSSSNPRGVKVSQERLDKVIKERPYPLFLAEKGASLLLDPLTSKPPPPLSNEPKEHIVVLGTGWGAAAFLKNIDTDKYRVTVVSPRNYFVFTPMLAGASVGTVDFKSITEPVREINNKVRYLEAAATEIDPVTNTISCISIVCEGNSCETEEFDINYDRLLFSVGAQTTTFGTPGVEEYCNYLKQVGDAQQIKNAIVNCFESAGLPNLTTEEEIRKELTFVIVGAGPTGIEFAAELLDFIEIDGPRYYKELLPYVRIKIVEAAPSILRPFEDGMKDEAIRRLTRTIEIEGVATLQPCEILLNKQVSEVSANYIYFKDGEKIEYGMSLWAAGVGPLPITSDLIETLEETEQKSAQEYARGRLGVDPWLRVNGGEGKIFALGDCSCVSNTPFLPATAQVASQQGEFLGKLLSNDYCIDAKDDKLLPPMVLDPSQTKSFSEQIASFTMGEGEIAAPFQYLDLGILAYTGSGSALAQLQVAPGKGDPTSETWNPVRLQIKGKLGFGLWRSIYLLKQTSPKNVVLVTLDWIKVKLFGRDISIL
mmetsp:Transcript_6252/g.15560  ORF Transcript_6252/g.15560 Transcript_6252/m.15560 type:complete len:613 (-) Transcript_6252:398-2236(-)